MNLIPFSRYKIIGHSMEPTLKSGQVVWVNHWAYLLTKPKVNEVVVFKKSNQELIKRVTKITNGLIHVAGDNKTDSLDSRSFGVISKKDIIGKMIV